MNTPRDWIQPWPRGTPQPGAPRAAIWLAHLVSALDDHGWTAADVATATGLPLGTVRAVIHGTRWPTLHTATTLAELPLNRTSTGEQDQSSRPFEG